jgi:SAM-dependent methyltransferase
MSRPTEDLARQGIHGEMTTRFYDAVAADYDALVGQADGVELRLAFCERVASIAGPGGLILDFGCGTGIDAAWYAARGHRVVAYDISSGMVDVLRARCRNEIESGQVILAVDSLDALALALEACGRVAAIAANFAVLNHVRDLKPLLQQLGSHLAPGGALVANVLNPFYRHDMRRAWWWRSAWRSRGAGPIQQDGKVTCYKHFVGAMRKATEPHFIVEEVRAARAHALLGALDSTFLFVNLRKRP